MKTRPLAGGRSPRWAFMEKFSIPAFDEPLVDYLTRLRIVQTPWFGIYLHTINRPDSRPTLHDHPWPFFAIVLSGHGYVEMRWDPNDLVMKRHCVSRFNWMPTHSAHYVEMLLSRRVRTLVFVGPRVRKWGYLEHDRIDPYDLSDHRMRWTPFDEHPYAFEFDAAMAARMQR